MLEDSVHDLFDNNLLGLFLTFEGDTNLGQWGANSPNTWAEPGEAKWESEPDVEPPAGGRSSLRGAPQEGVRVGSWRWRTCLRITEAVCVCILCLGHLGMIIRRPLYQEYLPLSILICPFTYHFLSMHLSPMYTA